MTRHVLLLAAIALLAANSLSAQDKTYILSLERVNVTYLNQRHFTFLNLKSGRLSRRDPKYYMQAHFGTARPLDNNYTIDLHFYEFRSNEYRRGFVEFHIHGCALLNNTLFGPPLRANGMICPLPKGEYRVVNATVPEMPLLRTFPFRKGRVYVDVEFVNGERVLTMHIDVEIKAHPK